MLRKKKKKEKKEKERKTANASRESDEEKHTHTHRKKCGGELLKTEKKRSQATKFRTDTRGENSTNNLVASARELCTQWPSSTGVQLQLSQLFNSFHVYKT